MSGKARDAGLRDAWEDIRTRLQHLRDGAAESAEGHHEESYGEAFEMGKVEALDSMLEIVERCIRDQTIHGLEVEE